MHKNSIGYECYEYKSQMCAPYHFSNAQIVFYFETYIPVQSREI